MKKTPTIMSVTDLRIVNRKAYDSLPESIRDSEMRFEYRGRNLYGMTGGYLEYLYQGDTKFPTWIPVARRWESSMGGSITRKPKGKWEAEYKDKIVCESDSFKEAGEALSKEILGK